MATEPSIVTLPRHRDALRVMERLEAAGHGARLAGGCVRDRILGLQPADFDVATSATPDVVQALFVADGIKVVPTGIEHGTVTLVMKYGPVEVTTLRRDVKTDGRRAEVEFAYDFEDDAARRDFTMNAMFEDRAGVVHDYFGGQADLAAQCLRFVGEPALRMREDYLRILRLFRFWSRLGFAPDAATLNAVKAEREGLARISQERITSELWKIFAGEHLVAVMEAMVQTSVWPMVLPEVAAGLNEGEAAQLWNRAAREHLPAAVLAVLVLRAGRHAEGGELDVKALGQRLRLPTSEIRKLAVAQKGLDLINAYDGSTASSLDLVDAGEEAGFGGFAGFLLPVLAVSRMGEDFSQVTNTLSLLARIENDALKYEHRRVVKLPLDANTLVKELAIEPGPRLGVLLVALRRAYRNGLWENASDGLEWARTQLKMLP